MPNNLDPVPTSVNLSPQQLITVTQSITDLETTHRYLRSLEGTPTLHVQVLQRVFVKFGDSYTLMDVYNIFQKAGTSSCTLWGQYYEASIMFKASAYANCNN
jgi:hypothetical protein